MWLIVGLGNPGEKYATHRHNVGFMVVDRLLERCNASSYKSKYDAHAYDVSIGYERALVIKPQTYMNESGKSVAKAANFYKIPPEHILVVHDELDLEPGVVRVKTRGGAAGHNGIKSIIQWLGDDAFVRVRVGVGRPPGGGTVGYVLTGFHPDEHEIIQEALARAVDCAYTVVSEGAKQAMNVFHSSMLYPPPSQREES